MVCLCAVCVDRSSLTAAACTHLPSGQVFGVVVQVVNVGAEGLEVRHDELLPEGLCEQDDVALDTSKRRDELRLADELCVDSSDDND